VYRVNIEYLKLALRGVTIVAASGDSGAPGRSNEMCQDPDVNRNVMPIFPGSSPFVLSAGATYVVSNGVNKTDWKTPLCQQNGCTTGTTQAPIMFPDVYWTAGGGFSIYSSRQSWQDVAVQSYMSQNLSMPTVYNKNGRAYPDVAVVGHNCPTWIEGSLIQVDGTSCSSPILASMIAIMNDFQVQRGQPRLGLVAPLLYDMYNSDPSIFTDITEGFNWCTESLCCPTRADGGSDYGYLAGTGFDPVTGLGTPNLGKMLTYLETFRK
jgi:tripeptidyl-peptidase-1